MTYGLTEMGSQVATTQKNQTKPRVLKYRSLKISNDGEILVRGQTLFKGYFIKAKIVRALDKNGWFHTGDLGSYSKKEGLKVLGRKDNMFISGGENIYPEEIERALLNTGLVKQAVVIPVKDAEFGFRPVAFISYRHCEEGVKRLTRQSQLQKALANVLPSFKIPDKFYKLPDQKSLKPNRQGLRSFT